jgi:thiosulfate/3-mercaptopyruvate sulfurtransferase
MSDFGPLIRATELANMLDQPDLRVVDCRFDLKAPGAGREAWRSGHIPGAAFLDLEQDLSGPIADSTGRHPLPDPEVLAAAFARTGIHQATRVVVYDAGHGGIAARSWWLLRWLGHDNVALLEQGMAGWTAAGYEIEGGEVNFAATEFRARPRSSVVVSTDDVVANGDSGFVLVDARERSRYLGEEEPIDPVAGRIPGARSLPFLDLLDPQGRFLDPNAIRDRFNEVIGPGGDRNWVAMCGSGVTACHLAVSAAVAGYPEPRIYVGSFSEWIRDPARAVATGK